MRRPCFIAAVLLGALILTCGFVTNHQHADWALIVVLLLGPTYGLLLGCSLGGRR